MITGKTKSGFEYNIDETILDDYELFELICDVENGANLKTPQMIAGVLGEAQKKRLVEHLKKQNGGRCPISAMSEEFTEIMTGASETKNS